MTLVLLDGSLVFRPQISLGRQLSWSRIATCLAMRRVVGDETLFKFVSIFWMISLSLSDSVTSISNGLSAELCTARADLPIASCLPISSCVPACLVGCLNQV